ncbi:hypothetical protein [Labrys neptuniae]
MSGKLNRQQNLIIESRGKLKPLLVGVLFVLFWSVFVFKSKFFSLFIFLYSLAIYLNILSLKFFPVMSSSKKYLLVAGFALEIFSFFGYIVVVWFIDQINNLLVPVIISIFAASIMFISVKRYLFIFNNSVSEE